MLPHTAAKSLQLCPTLCNPIDSGPPGSPVPGTLQARTLEWVAISFSNAWKGKVKVKSLSRVRLFGTPWSAAYQAPPSMGFSRQEYWSGVPLPSPYSCIVTCFSFKVEPSQEQLCRHLGYAILAFSFFLKALYYSTVCISSSVVPFSSCPQSLPASGSFQMSQFFASGGQSMEFQLQHQSFQWIFRTDFL